MQDIAIFLDAWMIEDHYPDFAVGDCAKFALEFVDEGLRPSAGRQVQAVALDNGVYRVCAQVVYVHQEVWVIDFGLCAFSAIHGSAPPAFAVTGQWVEGVVQLGIDPAGYYAETLHALPHMPELAYAWTVTGILCGTEAAPERVDTVQTSAVCEQTARVDWLRIAKTDVWNDDSSKVVYLLELCLDTRT